MQKLKVFILLANPDTNSYNSALADMYEKKMRELGCGTRRQNIGELKFDPVLWQGYKKIQPLEPDLLKAQENILWCNRWVIIYPIWWGSVPALLKGFLDRVLLPGFAFRYHDKGPLWDKLLKGRSAHIITTGNAPNWWTFWAYRDSDINTLKRAVLKFCGIKPVKVTRIDNMRHLTHEQLDKKLNDLYNRIK